MKKLLAVVAAAGFTVSSAMATIQVNWTADDGVLAPLGGPLAAGSLVQLLWSPTDPTASFSTAHLAENLGNWGGNTVIWTSATPAAALVSGTSGLITEAALGVSEPTLLGGYVFVRVFSVASSPTVGDYIALSLLTSPALGDMDPVSGAGQPTLVSGPSDNINGDAFSGIGSNPQADWVQIVPEPSVLAFLGIGAALVGIRRMRRS